jgi:hypothetical protein
MSREPGSGVRAHKAAFPGQACRVGRRLRITSHERASGVTINRCRGSFSCFGTERCRPQGAALAIGLRVRVFMARCDGGYCLSNTASPNHNRILGGLLSVRQVTHRCGGRGDLDRRQRHSQGDRSAKGVRCDRRVGVQCDMEADEDLLKRTLPTLSRILLAAVARAVSVAARAAPMRECSPNDGRHVSRLLFSSSRTAAKPAAKGAFDPD